MKVQLNIHKIFKNITAWQVVFSLMGLATSLYLFVHHTRLESGIQESASFCSFGKFMDCDSVNVSRYAEFLGIPIAALGAVYFFLLFAAAVFVTQKDKCYISLQQCLAWLTSAATLYNLILFLGVQLLILKTFCILCFLTYLCTGGHLALNIKNLGISEKQFKDKLKRVFRKPDFKTFQTIPRMRWVYAGISVISFIGVVSLLPYFVRSKSSANTFVENSIQQFYAQWKDLPQKKLPVSSGDGTWGNPNSPIQIVEFSDFECPFCRKAAFTLHTALKFFEKRVHFVFKNFPLDSTCNPNLPYQLHAHACKLARLAACAQMKGKFWDFHDEAFLNMTDEDIKEGFDYISEKLKPVFSKEAISECLSDNRTLKKITEDIEQGTQLKVKATPSIYINGKLITIPVTVESLEKLISLEESLHK
ncbi:MAG: thioredoxin domain-containing protein [Deltaproteobacteria bacterium]